MSKPVGFLKNLGPGPVTGAADDDPSGIATYSQIGAQFGYSLAWTMLFSFPVMAVIQSIAARIGCVSGHGIAHNLRRHYSPWLLRVVVLLLVAANVINLGADIGAMGAALGLLIGGPIQLYAVVFDIVCVLLETFMSYARYCAALKWTTLCLFAYVAVVFAAHVPWEPHWPALSSSILLSISSSPWRWSPFLAQRSAPIYFFGRQGRR